MTLLIIFREEFKNEAMVLKLMLLTFWNLLAVK